MAKKKAPSSKTPVRKSSSAFEIKLSKPEVVDAFILALKHPKLDVLKALRKVILSADKAIGEEINDTSGLFTGDFADGRRLATFYTTQDVKKWEKTILQLIKKWLNLLEK